MVGKYIQWKEILRDALNGKWKIVQIKRTGFDPEREEGEIEDKESDFEHHDTSERDSCYSQITKFPEDKLNLHTEGALNTGEIKTENFITENKY